MLKRKYVWNEAWQSYVPDGWEEVADAIVIDANRKVTEFSWRGTPHCPYCQTLRDHARANPNESCNCWQCGVGAQHQADIRKENALAGW